METRAQTAISIVGSAYDINSVVRPEQIIKSELLQLPERIGFGGSPDKIQFYILVESLRTASGIDKLPFIFEFPFSAGMVLPSHANEAQGRLYAKALRICLQNIVNRAVIVMRCDMTITSEIVRKVKLLPKLLTVEERWMEKSFRHNDQYYARYYTEAVEPPNYPKVSYSMISNGRTEQAILSSSPVVKMKAAHNKDVDELTAEIKKLQAQLDELRTIKIGRTGTRTRQL